MRFKSCLIVSVALMGMGLAAPVALADNGGTTPPGLPSVESVECLKDPEVACEAADTVYRGRSIVIRGRGLASAARVIFRGRPSRRDDVAASVVRRRNRFAIASVPRSANSGLVTLITGQGTQVPTRRVRVARMPKGPALDIAPSTRFFFAARRKPSFSFEVGRPVTARVELVDQTTQEIIRYWDVPASPGQPAAVKWDGTSATGSETTGSYEFRLTGEAAGAARITANNPPGFFFADHLFPIRGRHNLGYTDTNSFGGSRGHKGQDMFARCGTRVAAARGGKVQFAGYQRAAGNYVVIDGAETGVDYVYMHMRRPPLVETGEKVFTGQQIGEVGETGRATGCHLHFEMWTAPGWYQGGQPSDPLPALRAWDSYS